MVGLVMVVLVAKGIVGQGGVVGSSTTLLLLRYGSQIIHQPLVKDFGLGILRLALDMDW